MEVDDFDGVFKTSHRSFSKGEVTSGHDEPLIAHSVRSFLLHLWLFSIFSRFYSFVKKKLIK